MLFDNHQMVGNYIENPLEKKAFFCNFRKITAYNLYKNCLPMIDNQPFGLYHPDFEHDACGIGFVAHIKGIKSHRTKV